MVKPETLGRIIDEHPFFQGIAADLRDTLIACASNERFEAGQMLAKADDDADKFYLVRAGTVAVEIDQPGQPPIIIETIHEGDVVGWSWIVPPYRMTFDVRAVTLVRALAFDAKCLRRKMEEDHALGFTVLHRFLPVMAHRLSAARLQMLDLYGPRKKPAPTQPAKTEKVETKSKGKNRSPDSRLEKAKDKPKAKDKDKAKGKKKDG